MPPPPPPPPSNATAAAAECWPVESVALGRFVLVAVVGSLVALASCVQNALVFALLVAQRRHRRSHLLYWIWLALLDVVLAVAYFPTVAVDRAANYWTAPTLMHVWWFYAFPLMPVAHVANTGGCLVILLATVERLLLVKKSSLLLLVQRQRAYLCVAVVAMAVLIKAPMFFELIVVKNGNCSGMIEYVLNVTPLVTDYWYGTVYRIYVRSILSIFVPFILLAYCNLLIVAHLRQTERRATLFRFASSEHKLRARQATRMLVWIVFTYLVSSLLNVIVTAWERISLESLWAKATFYRYSTDAICLFTVLGGAARLPILLAFNQDLRDAFESSVARLRGQPHDESTRRPSDGARCDGLAVRIALSAAHVSGASNGVAAAAVSRSPTSPVLVIRLHFGNDECFV